MGNIAGIVVLSLLIGLLIIIGFVLINGKGSSIIAGYNTMTKEEQEKYDIVALCKFMGKMTFALAFSMVFWVVSEVIEVEWLFYFGLVLFIAITAFIVVYTNTGNRFKK